MTDIINAVKRERAEDIDVMSEKSPVGEHQRNGEVERAIQTIEGQVVTMCLAVEMRYGIKIDENHDIWPWMVTYGALLHNLCHITSDGRTRWEKRKCRRFGGDLPEFAENVMYPRPNSLGRD